MIGGVLKPVGAWIARFAERNIRCAPTSTMIPGFGDRDINGLKQRPTTNQWNLAKERYLPVLEEMFSKSSKKAIWQVLNENIKWYKSLGTFYKHTKNQDKHEYLAELFDHSDLLSVLKITNAEDKDIEKLLKDSSALESKSKALLHG